MRIQYFSDLHLEFLQPKNFFIKVNAPVLVLCGDIGNPVNETYQNFIGYVSSQFKKIFLLSGNHEYYGKSIIHTEDCIRKICDQYPNISYLQNSYEDYEGYRFAGTTLWSHIHDPFHTNNDFRYISGLSIDKYNELHKESRNFITKVLDSSAPPIIMLTHHLPSKALTDPYYSKYEKYHQCYSSACDDLIRYPIHSWIYGHTHRPFIGEINGVKMYCNPIGYKDENPCVDFEKTIDV